MTISTQKTEIVMKIRNRFLKMRAESSQIKNGAKKIGLFVAISAPNPQTLATRSESDEVAQNENIKTTKQTKSFKKLNLPMFSVDNPSLKTAMIEKSEMISSDVNLFVKPLTINASKTQMQAYIKINPTSTLTIARMG